MNKNSAAEDRECIVPEIFEDESRKSHTARRLKKRMGISVRIKIVLFFVALYAGFVISLIIPLRPSFSQVEKRELTQFPRFSVQTLFSGDYFEGIDTWFADTFPYREQLIGTYSSLKSVVIGNRSVQVTGTVETGDEIPDEPSENAGKATAEPSPSAEQSRPSASPPPIAAMGDTQSFGAVLLSGDSAFEYYNFDQEVTDRYISAVSSVAASLAGKASVYDMVVPNSMGIMLPDDLRDSVNSSDQDKAIKYMYGSMGGDVKTVDVYGTLMSHRDEYIYFRTDHHWTALGAYYAYEQFASAAGVAKIPLSRYETVDFPGFLGTFYSATGQNGALGANPDTVTAYKPFNNASLVYTDKDGQQVQWDVIEDVSDWDAAYKYNTFIGGDNPFTEITNNDLHDGSSIVVVKESYGNAFVPFLIADYEKVYVIDYRYWNGSITDFVTDSGVKNVLFLNNISMTRSDSLVGCIENVK